MLSKKKNLSLTLTGKRKVWRRQWSVEAYNGGLATAVEGRISAIDFIDGFPANQQLNMWKLEQQIQKFLTEWLSSGHDSMSNRHFKSIAL
jgi:hypothetical protein